MKASLLLIAWILFALALVMLLPGCAIGARAPAARSTAGSAHIQQTGDAAQPAKASSDATAAKVPLPAGSVVSFAADGSMSAKLSGESLFSAETRRDTVTGPQAFTPAAPPTPAEEAKGKAALWLRLGLVAGLAAGAFGLVKGWDLLGLGGGAVAGACFLGLSIEEMPVWLWIVLGVGGALAVAGPSLWHLRLKKLPAA